MSMIVDLYRLSEVEAKALLEWTPESHRPPARPWWQRLLIGSERVERPIPEVGPDKRYCLEKEWHGVHFLLSGTADEAPFPQGFLVSGGQELSHTDSGYGDARYFGPEQVGEIANFLDPISVDDLSARYDPVAMAEAQIYQAPDPEDETDVRQTITMFLQTYGPMKGFIMTTAGLNAGMLIQLS